MKWGVRRYQNYDGSYTQAGLKRYRTASENRETAQRLYDRAKADNASKSQLSEAKNILAASKRAQKSAYKQLVRDNLADQGRDLYQRGVRSESLKKRGNVVAAVSGSIITGAAGVGYKALTSGDRRTAAIASAAAGLAATTAFWEAGISSTKIKKLGNYYSHDSKSVDKVNQNVSKMINSYVGDFKMGDINNSVSSLKKR